VVAELTALEAAAEQDDGGASGQDDGGASGQSDGGVTGQQSCTIHLSARRTGPHSAGDDPANPRAPYTAVIEWWIGSGSGCADGGVRFDWKAPGETDWAESPLFPGTLTAYRAGFWPSKDEGTHRFRVATVDSAGATHMTGEVTVTIPAPATPPTPTPVPAHPGAGGNKPYDLRVWADNNRGLNLDWEAETLAAGRVLKAYVIEYRKSGETTAETLTLTQGTGDSEYDTLYTQRRIYGTDVDLGSQYQARVKARHTASDGTDSQDTGWTSWSGLADEAWQEVIQVWYMDETPNYNQGIGRFFMQVATNLANSSATCWITSTSSINCPPFTLVSLDVHNPGGKYHVRVTATKSGSGSVLFPGFQGRAKSAPPPQTRVSGGDGKLYVSWNPPHTLRTEGACHQYSGKLAGFQVQYRRASGSWSDDNLVTKGGWGSLYRVESMTASGDIVWDLVEEGDTLRFFNQQARYRGAYSLGDLPQTGNTTGDIALGLPNYALYRWSGTEWAADSIWVPGAAYLGAFNSEYEANQKAPARIDPEDDTERYAAFVSREHTWTGLASGAYEVRVAAVGDGDRSCHNGGHFLDDGRGFWSDPHYVEVGASQTPGEVTNPSLETKPSEEIEGGVTVTVTWDQPAADGDSNSWALIRYRPVGADPDAYEYTYVPGAPHPQHVGLKFHDVSRICTQEGEAWKIATEDGGDNDKGVQTCENPRVVEFDLENVGKLWEVGIAAINANGVSDWHDFDHFWHGPRR